MKKIYFAVLPIHFILYKKTAEMLSDSFFIIGIDDEVIHILLAIIRHNL